MSNDVIVVRLTAWQVGLRTIDLMKALCSIAEMKLPEAKRMVERLVDGEAIDVFFSDDERAREFRVMALKAGAIMNPDE
ncbi:MAG: hypothetical protein HC841_04375 [Verrucomicrobiae bacterium]|nr:hypothetical protein [Verrucomicrobiae bacterium]